jgi:phage baseplate assembly protein W
MAIKDFSILLEKVENNQSKKDIGLVTGYNSIVQAIEQVMKTQKGELISDSNIGSEYFSFIFQSLDRGSLEYNLASYIDAAIPQINDVKVILTNQSEETLSFQIQFSILDGIKVQKNASCFIEVDIS